ncbi:hypothetical protein [Embleya scabrispora]|uniref:hypothetical protein n=1 Tax=Embleya scabrispora TaxID=159449 RepID=UPI00117F47C9|nr:hypothetical protein [Embleya scabrispora]
MSTDKPEPASSDAPTLEPLRAAAAERDRLRAIPRHATPTVAEQLAHRRRLRAARYAVHAEVMAAYTAGVDIETIARAAGLSPKYTRTVLRQEGATGLPSRPAGPRPYAAQPPPPQHAAALAAITAEVRRSDRQSGPLGDATRAAVVEAARVGVPRIAIADAAGVTPQTIRVVLRAAGTPMRRDAQPSPAEVGAMRDALLDAVHAGAADGEAAERRAYRRLVEADDQAPDL